VDSCGVLGMEVGDGRTRPPETATVITEGDGARGISHAGTVDRCAAAASWSAQMNLSDALAHADERTRAMPGLHDADRDTLERVDRRATRRHARPR
jgi:hypothetical protein